MAEPTDHEARKIAGSFRPQWQPLAITVGANLLLAALLLGLPYVRGRELARTERGAYARLAQCMLGGTLPTAPGLGTPRGYRDHFAEKVLYAPRDWPLGCRSVLRELEPPDAVFLWPSIKVAGADLRAVAKLVDRELVALHRSRSLGSTSVPSRPLDALAKLQAAMTLMLQAAGTTEGIDADVVRLDRATALAAPARLPIYAGESAQLSLTSQGGVVEAFAFDGSGLSWLRMDAGKVDRERVKRAPLMRALLPSGEDMVAVSATAAERCAERADHCASRATGVTRYQRGASTLPAPIWLAAHPAARPDRAMRVDPSGRVDIVAQGDDLGALVLRRFQLARAPAAEDAPPSAAEWSRPVLTSAGESDAVLLDANPVAVAYAHVAAGAVHAGILSSTPGSAPVALEPTDDGTPVITACRRADTHVLAYGSSRMRRIAWLGAAGDVTYSGVASQRELPNAIHADDAALDRLRLLCTEHGAQLFELDTAGTLWLTTCAQGAACEPTVQLATGALSYAVLAAPQHTHIALAGAGREHAIRVLRVTKTGKPAGPPLVVAACFEPQGGMCGTPTLALDGTRVLLAAREDSDLLVLESNDDGAHFETLSGLKVDAALETGAHDPMQQHRIRKGIQ